jgi:tetratricopeptide (TPR) repeat protein
MVPMLIRLFYVAITTLVLAAMLPASAARCDDIARMRQLLSESSGRLLLSELGSPLQQPPGPERAARLWTDIGSAQAATGDHQAARESFDRAWAVGATSTDDFRRWLVLNRTVEEQARAGQIREALAHATAIPSVDDRKSFVLSIAGAQEMAKDFAGARQTIESLPPTHPETERLKAALYAETYALEQNFPAALALCDHIHSDPAREAELAKKAGRSLDTLSPSERSIVTNTRAKRSAVTSVVAILNRAGRFEEALEVAARLKGDPVWERCRATVAEAAAEAGQLVLAEKCFSELKDQYRKDNVAFALVVQWAKVGRFQEASDLTDRILDRSRKSYAIFQLAAGHALRGDDRSVRKEYDRVMAVERGTWGLANDGQKLIVSGYVRGGYIDKAASFAASIEAVLTHEKPAKSLGDGLVREIHWTQLSKIYQGVGSAAARKGARDVAKRMFERSRAAEGHDSDGRSKVRRLSELAAAEADAGLADDAVKCLRSAFDVAEKIDLDEDDVDDIVQLAATEVALGQRGFARETLSLAITSLSDRLVDDAMARSLQELAQAQAWILDVDDAIRTSSDQSAPFARASMEVGIVQGMLARREGKVLLNKQDPLHESHF